MTPPGTPPRVWTPDQVLAAAEDWVWVPPGADELLTEDYHLVAYPEPFGVPTQVAWCRSDRPARELVDEVLEQVRDWGRSEVSFWVGDRTRPEDLQEHLTERGAQLVETAELLALELSTDLPPALADPGFPGEVRLVADLETLRDAYAVAEEVWQQQRPDEHEMARTVEELTREGGRELRAVAYLAGQPVSGGGGTFVGGHGDVLRLWGAATRPAWRGRGAYRAVLGARLLEGRRRGATLALVRGLIGTSGPILRELGFESYGFEHRLRLSAEPDEED